MSQQELAAKVLAALGPDFAAYSEDDIVMILDAFLKEARAALDEHKERYPVVPGLFVAI